MNTVGIIILYNPDTQFVKQNINKLAACSIPTILVDNSASVQQFSGSSIHSYHHCLGNVGIAKAQNIGLQVAKESGFEYVFLLDQDSNLNTDLIRGVQNGMREAQSIFDKVASVSPRVVCSFSGAAVKPTIQKALSKRDSFVSVPQAIASGMLVQLEALKDVGQKDESLFIDGVDHEWCWRARKKGYHILLDERIEMLHTQGDSRLNVCGVSFKIGSEIRLYYQFRNVIALSRRSYVPFYWKCRQLLGLPIRYLVNRYLAKNGRQRGYFMTRGLRDGFNRKTGKFFEKS